jgi:deazaflavin-dependent oxidoreductase (nitroreductase family)
VLGSIATIVGVIASGLALTAALFVLGWRAKSPLVLRPIVWLSKRFINRGQMRTAGRPGAYAAIIRHRGRTTGTAYETPIGVVADDEGFLVALPYGTRTSWLRNVLASGRATLVHEGVTYEVDRPALIPMASVVGRFVPGDRRMFRILRVDECLRLRLAAESLAA